MAKKQTKSNDTKNTRKLASKVGAVPVRVLRRIGRGLAIITSPIRKNRVWKFLRRTVLRSPFRGYFVSSWQELKKVTWPTRGRAWRLTFVVVAFSAFFAALLATMDYGLENLAKRIFLQ